MSEENKIRDAADAIKGVVEAVPVYQDALQPAAQEIGKGLGTVAKTIHVALAPVSALVWGYEKICDFVNHTVAEKLKNVPPERVITPSPSVAGPALEALRYAGHEEQLREMYANLLANSMDASTAKNAHPSFVEIIKQLSPDEAKLLTWMSTQVILALISINRGVPGGGALSEMKHHSLFGSQSGCAHPELTPSYLDNICRLGLAEIPYGASYKDKQHYEALKSDEKTVALRIKIQEERKHAFQIEEQMLAITPFGRQFIDACVVSKF